MFLVFCVQNVILPINMVSYGEELNSGYLTYNVSEEAKLVEQTINENRPSGTKNIKTLAFLPDYKFDPETSDMTIANAAIAYFKLKNYKLSAHLLSRALEL